MSAFALYQTLSVEVSPPVKKPSLQVHIRQNTANIWSRGLACVFVTSVGNSSPTPHCCEKTMLSAKQCNVLVVINDELCVICCS